MTSSAENRQTSAPRAEEATPHALAPGSTAVSALPASAGLSAEGEGSVTSSRSAASSPSPASTGGAQQQENSGARRPEGKSGEKDANTEAEESHPASATAHQADATGLGQRASHAAQNDVSTLVTTTSDQETRQSEQAGRPGKAALAGAAIAGALLISVPFLLMGEHDSAHQAKAGDAPGTLLGGGEETGAPGAFVSAVPTPRRDGNVEKESGTNTTERPRVASTPAKAQESQSDSKAGTASKEKAGKQNSAPRKVSKDASTTTGAGEVSLGAALSLKSHESQRCIDVPFSRFDDGVALQIWSCSGSAGQKWQFAGDGTLRIKGMCMDVAQASWSDGTTIQLARCNGNPAQQFRLNESHDLVNPAADKCVDVRDHGTGDGARLQLWQCVGQDNQKWSIG
ncbi:ricin-type beta-trefoil lectin domain protein [Streptomyces sp. NPDC048473]|uniref:ricin-type beta-trefoil lectin domain protein n=1 Tax=unclassified Streptomyces TaxID=2593676 RepID=UPI003716988E